MLGEEMPLLGDWFILHFTENNGMAFGFELGGEIGKLILSIFRIIALSGIGWYIWHLHKEKAHTGLILSVSLVFAGALGNIVDSAFYGLIFNESAMQVATLFPEGGGYAGFLHGRVVDMFYAPIIKGVYPEWMPFKGGQPFLFFRPVFNIADSAISIGVFILLIFQKRFFHSLSELEAKKVQAD